jgi:hypothetical protein
MTIYSGSQLKYNNTSPLYFNITYPVTASIGEFEIAFPHGSGSVFSAYSDIQPFYKIFLAVNSNSAPLISQFGGRIDSIKNYFDKSRGYVTILNGRGFAESLFRLTVTKDYIGYTRRYFSQNYGASETGKDVRLLVEQPGTAQNVTTFVNVGSSSVGSLFRIKPYTTINASFGTTKPSNIQYTGSVSSTSFDVTGSVYKLNLHLFNTGSFAQGGKIWSKLWAVDDTGSLTNAVNITAWTASNTINFPAYSGSPQDATITFSPTLDVPAGKYIYVENLWEVTTAGTNAAAGFHVEMSRDSYFDIPNDYALATNIIIDLLSGSGLATGSVVWNGTPLTVSYKDKPRFEAIKEINNIIGQDSYTDSAQLYNSLVRQSLTNGGLLQTGSNIYEFTRNYDVPPVKNYVMVKGAAETMVPWDGDYWTEYSGSGWYIKSGSLTESTVVAGTTPVYGRKYLRGDADQINDWLIFGHEIPNFVWGDEDSPKLKFSCTGDAGYAGLDSLVKVRMKSSQTNYDDFFEKDFTTDYSSTGWVDFAFDLGEENTTGSVRSGEWVRHGSIFWSGVKFVEFFCYNTSALTRKFYVDGLRLDPIRWTGSASDAGSSGSFGYRPYKEISDYFHSHDECLNRAVEILSGSTNPVNQLTIVTTGSEGLTQGYRIQVNIPSEGISNQYLDVIEMTHRFNPTDGYKTELQLSDQKYIRDVSQLKNYGVENAVSKRLIDDALRGKKIFK